MKNDKKELNVDFIGGQEPLTPEEEKKLQDYFAKKKAARKKGHQKLEVL